LPRLLASLAGPGAFLILADAFIIPVIEVSTARRAECITVACVGLVFFVVRYIIIHIFASE
jgi:hypothetical protein